MLLENESYMCIHDVAFSIICFLHYLLICVVELLISGVCKHQLLI